MERIVLGYSGSLETSVAVPWLTERFGADVIAVSLDLGQGRELADVRERALSVGAIRAHVLDVRDELAREFLLPALQAHATRKDGAPLVAALARPLIATKLIDIARMEGATAIAHCALPCSDAEAQIESAAAAIDPAIAILGVMREACMTDEARIAYAKERNIFVPPMAGGVYRVDANLWGRSLLVASSVPPGESRDEVFVLTRPAQAAPDEPASIDITFEQGVPVRANGIEMPFAELIESVETIAGAHGVGRFDGPQDQADGLDVRHVHEAPAAAVLYAAHARLERAATSRELQSLKQKLGREYARLIDKGSWFTPAREAVDAFVASVQRHVTGTVRLELFKGACRAVTCRVEAPADGRGVDVPLAVAAKGR
jgi:argininosuccinate synthase